MTTDHDIIAATRHRRTLAAERKKSGRRDERKIHRRQTPNQRLSADKHSRWHVNLGQFRGNNRTAPHRNVLSHGKQAILSGGSVLTVLTVSWSLTQPEVQARKWPILRRLRFLVLRIFCPEGATEFSRGCKPTGNTAIIVESRVAATEMTRTFRRRYR